MFKLKVTNLIRAGCWVTACAAVVACGSTNPSRNIETDTVRARKLEIVDARGVTRISLSVMELENQTGPMPAYIELFDQYGEATLVICSGVLATGDDPVHAEIGDWAQTGPLISLESDKEGEVIAIWVNNDPGASRGVRVHAVGPEGWKELSSSRELPPAVR